MLENNNPPKNKNDENNDENPINLRIVNLSSIIILLLVGLLSIIVMSYSYLNKNNQQLLYSRSEVATTTTTTTTITTTTHNLSYVNKTSQHHRSRSCCPYPSSIMDKVNAWYEFAKQNGCAIDDDYVYDNIYIQLERFGLKKHLSPFYNNHCILEFNNDMVGHHYCEQQLVQEKMITSQLVNDTTFLQHDATIYTVLLNGTIDMLNINHRILDYPAYQWQQYLQKISHLLPVNIKISITATDEPCIVSPPSQYNDEAFYKHWYNDMIHTKTSTSTSMYMKSLYDSYVCYNASNNFHRYRQYHGYFQTPKYVITNNYPRFSMTTIHNCYHDIVLPSFFTENDKPLLESDISPWNEKREILFWRGSTNGAYITPREDFMNSHRPRFIKFVNEYNNNHVNVNITTVIPNHHDMMNYTDHESIEHHVMMNQKNVVPYIDAKFSSIPYGYPKKEFIHEFGIINFASYNEHWKYKYLMIVDGWTFNSRLQIFLSSGSLIFRASIFDEWYESLLQPYVHYLPIRMDYSDLLEKLKWAKEHDDEVYQIVQNARQLSLKYLHPYQHMCYSSRLLIEYATLYKDD